MGMDLQAILVSASSGMGGVLPIPHHPVTCYGNLRFDEDGTLACDHTEVEAGDGRLKAALTHSVAILLIELASKL